VWEPKTRGINIPVGYSGDTWKICLKKINAFVLQQLETDSPFIQKLKSKQGIAIGFIDGDLEIIWKS